MIASDYVDPPVVDYRSGDGLDWMAVLAPVVRESTHVDTDAALD